MLYKHIEMSTIYVQYSISIMYFLVPVLPLMQKHNVLDIPEDDLFLVEDVDGDVAASVQII